MLSIQSDDEDSRRKKSRGKEGKVKFNKHQQKEQNKSFSKSLSLLLEL